MLVVFGVCCFVIAFAVLFSLTRPSNDTMTATPPTHGMIDGTKVGSIIKCIETKRIAIFAIAKNANIATVFTVIWAEISANSASFSRQLLFLQNYGLIKFHKYFLHILAHV